MEDKKIIDLYFGRDELAIQETKNKYGSYCFKVAYNILFSKEESEECVNDTWRITWEKIPPTRPNKLKYFLAKITRGIALNYFRKNTADKRGNLEVAAVFEELENTFISSNDPQKEYEATELAQSINAFLKTQKERDRNIFIRRFFYMESVKKIADRYDLSETNVSVILNRIKKALKEELELEGYQ